MNYEAIIWQYNIVVNVTKGFFFLGWSVFLSLSLSSLQVFVIQVRATLQMGIAELCILFQSLFICRDRPLALYIFANDKSKIQRFMDSTSSGGFLANDTVVHAGGKYKFSLLASFGLK